MEMPREYQVKYGIDSGAVYVIEKDGDKNEHLFVVLNVEPKIDGNVILVCASTIHQRQDGYVSRIEKRFGIGTLVHIEAGESAVIKKDSTFDCNSIYDPTIEELCTSVKYTKIKYAGKIEKIILEQLREATLISPRLKKKYRAYIQDGDD
jgi:hypothetical protein